MQSGLCAKGDKTYAVETSQAIIAAEPKIAIGRLGQSLNRIMRHALLCLPRMKTEGQGRQFRLLSGRSRLGAAGIHKVAERSSNRHAAEGPAAAPAAMAQADGVKGCVGAEPGSQ